MAIILHFESSGPVCSVAVARDGKQLSLVEHPDHNVHAQQITIVMDQALADAEIELSDIQAIAISEGPGSYTGLRVAASAAKGICYAMDIPLIAISTLQSLADAAIVLDGAEHAIYIPMIDARRMEVYTAMYTADCTILEHPHAKIIDASGYSDLVTNPDKIKIYCGSGVEKCIEILDDDRSRLYVDILCRADNLVRLAFDKFLREDFVDVAYFKPYYLKSPNITKSKPML